MFKHDQISPNLKKKEKKKKRRKEKRCPSAAVLPTQIPLYMVCDVSISLPPHHSLAHWSLASALTILPKLPSWSARVNVSVSLLLSLLQQAFLNYLKLSPLLDHVSWLCDPKLYCSLPGTSLFLWLFKGWFEFCSSSKCWHSLEFWDASFDPFLFSLYVPSQGNLIDSNDFTYSLGSNNS